MADQLGEAFVLVSPDLRGFAARLRAELNAAVKQAKEPRVKIDPDLDTFGEKVKRKTKETEKTTKGKVPIAPDLSKFSEDVRGFLARFDPKEQIKIAAALERADLAKAVAEAKRIAKGAGVEIPVKVDRNTLRGATREISLLGRQARDSARQLTGAFNSGNQGAGGMRAAIRRLLPLLVALGSVGVAGLTSITAAAVAAAAAIAVLPGLLAAAAQGVGVAALAFSGIGDAVKAMGDAQATAGKDALSGAKQQASAARAVRDAQLAVSRATRDAAQANQDAARLVKDATRSLTETQRDARRAQLDLNQARRDARDGLIDLRLEESRLALDIQEATLSRAEAEAELQQVLANPASTDLEKKRAQLRAEQARLTERDIRRRIELNRREIKQGVEGSDQVRSAKEQLATANERVAEAERGVGDAVREAARQRVQATEQVTDAQRALADAQLAAAAATAATAAGVDKLGQAMAKLSPASQRFARFLFSLKPKLDELRGIAAAGFLPGVESSIGRLVGAHFPALRTIVDATAKTLGNLAVEGGQLLSSGPFRRDFARFGADNVRIIGQFGQGSLNLADAFRNVTSAARPLVLSITEMTLKWTENVQASAEAGRQSGKLGEFFERAGDALRSLLRIAGNIGGTLGAIFTAAFPSGLGLLKTLEDATGRMRDLATSVEGRQSLREFFDKAKPAIETVGGLLTTMARKLFEIAVHIKTATEKLAEFLDEHPELKEMLGTIAAIAIAAKAVNIGGILGAVGTLGAFANPVGLVVGAILLLAGAFAFAYFHSKPFKETVDRLAKTVKDAVLPALKSFGKFINEDVVPALKRAIPFIREQLVEGLRFLQARLKENEPQLKLVGRALLEIGKFIAVTVIPFLFRLYSVYLRGLFTALGGVVTVIGLVVNSFKFFLRTVLTVFGTILDGAARAFGWMGPLGDKLQKARDKFKGFAKGVNAYLDSTTKPRNIKVEANFGFQGLKTFNIKNSRVKAMAAGGRITEGTTPTADDVLIRASKRETVVSARDSDDPWFKTWAAWRRIPGFASGGRVGLNPETRLPPLSVLGQALGHFEEGIGEAVRSAADLFKRQGATGSGAVSGAKFGGGAMHYIAEFIRKAGVAFQIISGFRPGAVTRGTGSRSLHSLGRALDLVGSGKSSMMDIWAAATRIPFKKEVIFSRAPFQVYGRGRHPGPPTNPRTRADHYNHVHVGLFDRGGFLMPGLNLSMNRTGKPEKVTPAGRDAVGRLSFGQGMHVENLVVQPLAGQFRLRDVMVELALQGVH